MAVKRQYDAELPKVQIEQAWRERVQDVADHEEVNVSIGQVIRDCVYTALPAFELQLGILIVDDLDEVAEQIREAQGEERKREDRTVGMAWGPPRPE